MHVDNQFQITLHQEILEEVLGVEPVGFWNAERVWDGQLVDLIVDRGYVYSFLETSILSQSGLEFSEVRELHKVSHGDRSMYLVPDDLEFRNVINRRDPAAALSYLRVMNRRDKDDSCLIVYAEDAEATGLWDLESGNSPLAAIESLQEVLVRLIEEPEIRIVKLAEFVAENGPAAEEITPVSGQPRWMIGPSVALGYADWFDYCA